MSSYLMSTETSILVHIMIDVSFINWWVLFSVLKNYVIPILYCTHLSMNKS